MALEKSAILQVVQLIHNVMHGHLSSCLLATILVINQVENIALDYFSCIYLKGGNFGEYHYLWDLVPVQASYVAIHFETNG